MSRLTLSAQRLILSAQRLILSTQRLTLRHQLTFKEIERTKNAPRLGAHEGEGAKLPYLRKSRGASW